MSNNFGSNVDRLFKHGPVTFTQLALANGVDRLESRAKSKLDDAFESARTQKFQLDSLKVDRVRPNAPIDLDKLSEHKPYSGRLEKARDAELKEKFNLPQGLILESTAPKVPETKPETKKVSLESIGSSSESNIGISFTVQGGLRW